MCLFACCQFFLQRRSSSVPAFCGTKLWQGFSTVNIEPKFDARDDRFWMKHSNSPHHTMLHIDQLKQMHILRVFHAWIVVHCRLQFGAPFNLTEKKERTKKKQIEIVWLFRSRFFSVSTLNCSVLFTENNLWYTQDTMFGPQNVDYLCINCEHWNQEESNVQKTKLLQVFKKATTIKRRLINDDDNDDDNHSHDHALLTRVCFHFKMSLDLNGTMGVGFFCFSYSFMTCRVFFLNWCQFFVFLLQVQDFRFLCPNGTAFDQEAQTCADFGDVDCEQATLFYGSDNFDLYRIGSGYDTPKRPTPPATEDESTFHLQRAESSKFPDGLLFNVREKKILRFYMSWRNRTATAVVIFTNE